MDDIQKLRDQKERLQRDRERRVRAQLAEVEAARLRREITELGEEPCA